MAIFQYRSYPNEHYFTVFNPETGFFVRAEDAGHEEPFWSAHGPEMLDISITSWCSHECPTCYRAADRSGSHILVRDYDILMQQAAPLGVMQVALGGGNPNEHPCFSEILRLTRRGYGIVPNYTTNGCGLSSSVLHASAEHCGAVAVSAYEPFTLLEDAVGRLKDYGVRTNIHFVLDAQSAETALAWLRDPPRFLRSANAIVFLNYKPVGRGASKDRLLCHSNVFRNLIDVAISGGHEFKVGFDSCMVSGVVTTGRVDPTWYDACEAARFSMFVSEDLEMFPCSFMEPTRRGIRLGEMNLLDAWQHSELFRATRAIIQDSKCRGCTVHSICRSGCPVFPEINLCHRAPMRAPNRAL